MSQSVEEQFKQAEQIGIAFVTQYYECFNTNRMALLSMYHPTAWFAYEDKKACGPVQIKSCLESLGFSSIMFKITKVDTQPMADNGILVLVNGRLQTDNDPPHAFSQTFCLKNQNGNFFICHDMFRLSIHDSG